MSQVNPINSIGDEHEANQLALRAEVSVPAYRQFLDCENWNRNQKFSSRPLTDKKNYISQFPMAEMLADNWDETFTVFRSSGSSGQCFYWPQLKGQDRFGDQLRQLLEATFSIHEKKSLAIVGLALGSWIGGDHLSWVLKNSAYEAPYPFSVFSPGSNHLEIIEMAARISERVDQIILFVCPSAIGHILLKAKQEGIQLPLNKLRFVVLGEPFPENMRQEIEQANGIKGPAMLSLYGSADTGILGFESPLTITMRRLLHEQPDLLETLGLPRPAPHLFHIAETGTFLETVSGELCVTRWQGVPLIRYNLKDQAWLYRYQDMCELFQRVDSSLHLENKVYENSGILLIAGRSDNSLILCGTNINESMLDASIKGPELANYLSGNYLARLLAEDGRTYLEIDLEFKADIDVDSKVLDTVYSQLVRNLCVEQPEFLDDWNNVYKSWDEDPSLRILRLNPLIWPQLANNIQNRIKHRGIET